MLTLRSTAASEEKGNQVVAATEALKSAEGPIYSVPEDTAQRLMMSHQVQIGEPSPYMHKMSRPKYMDTHERPYAAFTFYYRSKGTTLDVVIKTPC